MANAITSELVLKLKDDLSAPADKAASALGQIEKAEARLVERSKALEAATKQLANLGKLDDRLGRTKERLASEEAAVKRLSEAMSKVEKPTKKMVEALMKAEATVKLTNEAIDQQKRKVDRAGEAFEKLAGSPFTDLAHAEARLRDQIEQTTAAIRTQAEVSNSTRETEGRNLRRREAMAHSFKETMSTLGMLGGPETLHLTKEAAKAGADVQHTRVEMKKAGMSPEAIAATEKQAYELSAEVRNVSPVEIMDIAKEARSVLTDPKDLAKVLPQLAKAQSVLSARDPSGEQSQSLAFLVKGAENIGAAKDPERLNKLIDGAVRAMQVMGKTIDAEQFYAFLKNSRLAGAQLSDRFIMTTGMSTLQEMGGQTAGKAVNEMTGELIGGLEHRNVAVRALKKLHLIDGKDIAYSKTGEVTGVKRGRLHVVKGDEKLAHDPDLWVYQDLLPAMRQAGITKMEDQLAISRQIFSGSKTAQDLVGKLITQQESYAAHAGNYPKAAGTEGYKQNRDDATAALKGLTTQFESFAGALTSPMMKEAGHVLDMISGKLGEMTTGLHGFAEKHPAEAALLGGTALAGGALAGGKLTYGLFSNLLGGGAELKGSATLLTTAANTLLTAAERLGGGKPGEPGTPAEPPKDAGKGGRPASVPPRVIGAGVFSAMQMYSFMPDKSELQPIDRSKPYELPEGLKGSGVDSSLSNKIRDWLFGKPGAKATPVAGARAAGGPVSAGKTYLVGERGPELFTAGATGQITNNGALLDAVRDRSMVSTVDVQRMLARVALNEGASAGYGREMAKVVQALGVRLSDSVEVQRMLVQMTSAKKSDTSEFAGELAKAVQVLDFGLSRSADRIVKAIDRLLERQAITSDIDVGSDGGGAGGGHAGGRRGFMSRMGAGEGGRPFNGNPGVGHWWTKDRISHAVDRLMGEAHLSRAGAEGLVSRWATVEAAGGPTAVNPKSGAWGIGQWLGSRGGGRTTDFDGQLAKAIGELNGPEKRAAQQLRAAQDAHAAAIGASMFERAEHYNAHTGVDDWTAKSEAGNARLKGILNGTEQPGDVAGAGPGISSSKAVDSARAMIGMNDSAAGQALHHYMHSGAWCADFVNGTLAKIGGRGTNNALAASFFNWGKGVTDPTKAKAGDVMVAGHHVGFAEGPAQMHNGRMMVPMISGNHGHRVGESWEPVGKYQIRRGESSDEHVAEAIYPRARQIRSGLDELHGGAIAPAVDTRHLERTAELLDRIHNRIGSIKEASLQAHKRVSASPSVSGLGSRIRGNFSSSGPAFG